MSKCMEDFYQQIEPRSTLTFDTAYVVAVNALQQLTVGITGELSYQQRNKVLADVSDLTARNSRERQHAFEQVAVIADDTFIASAAAKLGHRLNILERVQGRLSTCQDL